MKNNNDTSTTSNKESKERYANFRGAEIVEVIRLEVNEGSGVKDDPYRRVTYYLTKDGDIIGHNDTLDCQFRGES